MEEAMPKDKMKTIADISYYETSPDGRRREEKFSLEDLHFAKDPFKYHLAAYRRHGPIYRCWFRNQEWVAMGGLEANDFAWRQPDIWSYKEAMAGFGKQLGFGHVTTLDGPPHRLKRRSLKPGFGNTVFQHLPAMSVRAAAEINRNGNRKIDLHQFFMGTLIRLSAGTLLKTGLDDEMVQAMVRFEEMFMYGLNLGEYGDEYFAGQEYQQTKGKVFAFLQQLIEKRGAAGSPDDCFSAIREGRPEQAGPYESHEKLDDAYLLLVAGAENTARLLSWCVQYICGHPEWLEELRVELKENPVDGFRDGMAPYPKLKNTIMEVERLQPGAYFHVRTTAEPVEFLGYRLPVGTEVLHIQGLCHFLEEIYENPFAFNPRRWDGREYPRKAHGTFGGGTHVCLGINLARIHTPLILANLLGEYDLEFDFKPGFNLLLEPGGGFRRFPLPARFIPINQ